MGLLRAFSYSKDGTSLVVLANPTIIVNGQQTISITDTAVPLVSVSTSVAGVIIQALAANSGNVYVGDASVTTADGFELQPGQATSVAIDNLDKIYINGTVSDGVCFIAS